MTPHNDRAEAILRALEQGTMIDVSLGRGVLRSSKTAYAVFDSAGEVAGYRIMHYLDGTVTGFTLAGMMAVLRGERDPWEGDCIQ